MELRKLLPVSIFLVTISVALFLSNLVVSNQLDQLLLFLIALAVFVFGLYAKTEYLIYLTCYVLLAGSSSEMSLRNMSFYLRFGIMALFVVRFLLFQIKKKSEDTVTSPAKFTLFHWVIFSYVLLALVSASYSIDPPLTVKRAIAIGILFSAVFLGLYWDASSMQRMQKFVKVLVKSNIVLLLVGFALFALGSDRAVNEHGRLRLFLFGPNELGYICAILFPAAFWYYSEAKSRQEKIFAGVGAAMFVIAMVWTASRGCLLAFGVSGLLLIVLAYRRKLAMYSVIVFTVTALAYVFFLPKVEQLRQEVESNIIRSETLETGSGRLDIWKRAWSLSQEKAALGYGFGTITTLFYLGYFASHMGDFQGAYIHNSYLEIILDLGWAGLSFFVFGLMVVFFKSINLLKQTKGTEHSRFVATIFCCFFSGMTSAMFESWMTSPGSIFSFPFWLSAAFLLRMPSVLNLKRAST